MSGVKEEFSCRSKYEIFLDNLETTERKRCVSELVKRFEMNIYEAGRIYENWLENLE